MIPQIPQDIIDSIIDEVYRDSEDFDDLKSCALVCKEFLYPSRRHLFHTIRLKCHDVTHTWDKYHRMEDAISSCPQISLLVQNLTLVENGRFGLLINLKSFSDTILTLRNLKVLHLNLSCDWCDMTPEFRQAFMAVLSSHPLEKLVLDGIYSLPLGIAQYFKYIPDVSLLQVKFSPSLHQPNFRYAPPRNAIRRGLLKSLAISGSNLPEDCINECVLETLTIQSYGGIVYANIMESHSNSLTAIYIRHGLLGFPVEDEVHYLKQPDIGILPHLRTIGMFTPMGFTMLEPFNYFTKILRTARDGNHIQIIVIQFCLWDCPDALLEASNAAFWEEWDAVLSESRFAQLRELLFTATGHTSIKHVPTGPKVPLWRYLPRLRQRGVLKVDDTLASWVDIIQPAPPC